MLPDESSRRSPAPSVVSAAPARRPRRSSAVRSSGVVDAPTLPGRLERRGDELRDGAHNPAGARWLVAIGSAADYVVVRLDPARQGRRRDARRALAAGGTLVATRSSNARALTADELAERAAPYFARVEAVADPAAALARAHELGAPVLVTGSLYLLADLARRNASRDDDEGRASASRPRFRGVRRRRRSSAWRSPLAT